MLVTALIFAMLIALFAVQNATIVTIRVAVWSFDVSLVLVVLGAATLGALGALMWSLVKGLAVKGQLQTERARVQQLEAELRVVREKLRRLETGHA